MKKDWKNADFNVYKWFSFYFFCVLFPTGNISNWKSRWWMISLKYSVTNSPNSIVASHIKMMIDMTKWIPSSIMSSLSINGSQKAKEAEN